MVDVTKEGLSQRLNSGIRRSQVCCALGGVLLAMQKGCPDDD
jgi:hypothetical protein